jgi:predicted transcriptional regulator of viral defense system
LKAQTDTPEETNYSEWAKTKNEPARINYLFCSLHLLILTIIGNKMTYLAFRDAIRSFEVFSTRDIEKLFPKFDTRRLVEWQRKGYIQKLINKWYVFADIPINEWLRYRISNCLYRPSYVSLESALSHYGLIPEAVYSVQNITTKKTIAYETVAGTINYRSIKPHLFFGYKVDKTQTIPVLIASPEKAILDYFYLNPRLHTTQDIEGLRLNLPTLNEIVNHERLTSYAACFESNTLNKRLKLLRKINTHADTI